MKQHRIPTRIVTAALLVALPALGVPVAAADSSGVSGVVVSSASRTPLVGARVHVADTGSGEIFSSPLTDDGGRFAIATLPPAAYEVAVEVDGGLYVVDSRLALAPGQSRDLSLAIDDRAPRGAMNAKQTTPSKLTSAWNNPGVAIGIVVGSAFLVGALVDDAIEDDPASKFLPN